MLGSGRTPSSACCTGICVCLPSNSASTLGWLRSSCCTTTKMSPLSADTREENRSRAWSAPGETPIPTKTGRAPERASSSESSREIVFCDAIDRFNPVFQRVGHHRVSGSCPGRLVGERQPCATTHPATHRKDCGNGVEERPARTIRESSVEVVTSMEHRGLDSNSAVDEAMSRWQNQRAPVLNAPSLARFGAGPLLIAFASPRPRARAR